MSDQYICQFCKREVLELTDHHIIPRSYGGKQCVEICEDCHRQIHTLYNNKTLAEQFNTIEYILNDEQFVKYLNWVKQKPFGIIKKVKRSKSTRKRGRKG